MRVCVCNALQFPMKINIKENSNKCVTSPLLSLRSAQIYSAIFLSFTWCAHSILCLLIFGAGCLSLLFAYSMCVCSVLRLVSSFILLANEIFAWQPIEIKQCDANLNECVNGNKRNLYANIFVFTSYFIVFHFAIAGTYRSHPQPIHTHHSITHTVSPSLFLNAFSFSICSVSENKSSQKTI